MSAVHHETLYTLISTDLRRSFSQGGRFFCIFAHILKSTNLMFSKVALCNHQQVFMRRAERGGPFNLTVSLKHLPLLYRKAENSHTYICTALHYTAICWQCSVPLIHEDGQ